MAKNVRIFFLGGMDWVEMGDGATGGVIGGMKAAFAERVGDEGLNVCI
jgi:hypothetical protein